MARPEVVARHLEVDLDLIDFACLHPSFLREALAVSHAQDSLLHVVGRAVRMDIDELGGEVGVARRGRDVQHQFDRPRNLQALFERWRRVDQHVVPHLEFPLVTAARKKVGMRCTPIGPAQRRHRCVGVIDETIGGFVDWRLGTQPSAPHAAVRCAFAVQVVLGELGAGERPFVLAPPLAAAHYVDSEFRQLGDPVSLALQPVIEPAEIKAAKIKPRVSDIALAHDGVLVRSLVRAMHPGRDHRELVVSRACALAVAGE